MSGIVGEALDKKVAVYEVSVSGLGSRVGPRSLCRLRVAGKKWRKQGDERRRCLGFLLKLIWLQLSGFRAKLGLRFGIVVCCGPRLGILKFSVLQQQSILDVGATIRSFKISSSELV